MNKFQVFAVAAVLSITGIARADNHAGAKGQTSDAAPAVPAGQNGSRGPTAGVSRYSGQGPGPTSYAGVPISRPYTGSLPAQRNVNGVPNWRAMQFDNRVLADQTAIPRRTWKTMDQLRDHEQNSAVQDQTEPAHRTWKTLDQLRNRQQNLAFQGLRGRRNRDANGISPADNAPKAGGGDRVASDPAKVAVANNWRNRGNKVVPFDNSNTVSFSDAWQRCHEFGRDRHDRDWWHHRCNTIIFISGGFWAWDAGWWYPAWGYDPYYSNYAYNGPIYGYDGLPPDQVIANVQGALQELGYFPDAVDGVLGPTTQQAIADYQNDHGLPATGAIDRPTLASLGFVY